MQKYFLHVTCVLLRGYCVAVLNTIFFIIILGHVHQLLEIAIFFIQYFELSFTTTIITVCLINSTIVFFLVRPWGWPYYNYLRLTFE